MAFKKKSPKVNRKPVSVVDEDEKFLAELAGKVNKTLGKEDGGIMIGDEAGDQGIPYWILTGIPQLDFAIGGYCHPGVPGARIIEIFGLEAVGKSTLALWIVRRAIEQEKAIAYYQDAERVLTPEIIKGTGVNMNRVMRDQPDTLEDVFDAQQAVLDEVSGRKGAVITVLDSIAACSTMAEIEGDMTDQQVGSHARVMSKGLRKIKSSVLDSCVLSLWVNQIREKIGGVSWGDKTTTFGGRAMSFYASVRIALSKIKTLKKGKDDSPYGCTIEAYIKKDKVAPPLKKATYDILFIQDKNGSYPRIDIEGAILDWCKENNLIGGSTGRYEIDGKNVFKEQARKMMMEDEELFKKMWDLAYSVTNSNLDSSKEDSEDEED